jgi:uncharacterized protein YgfB (UPF0149 family)
MLILFLKSNGPRKATRKRSRTDGDEALEKIRSILEERVDEAKTDEDREHAERELQKIE